MNRDEIEKTMFFYEILRDFMVFDGKHYHRISKIEIDQKRIVIESMSKGHVPTYEI